MIKSSQKGKTLQIQRISKDWGSRLGLTGYLDAEGRMHSRLSRIILETSLSQKPREAMSTMVVRAVGHLEM